VADDASTKDDQILKDLADILEEVADVKPEDVSAEKSFVDDLDVDSLSMVEVAMAVEEKFDAKIPDEELSNLKTVGDAIDYIKKHQAGPAAAEA
jgi:acyl carrier protein